jgi:hypothetical protein
MDSQVFAHPITFKIWCWLLMKANHKDKISLLKIGSGYTEVNVKRGQFIFGRHKAEEALEIDGSTVYKHIQKLQEWNNISIESNNQYSIVTICNYEEYQSTEVEEEQPSNNQVTTEEQQSSSRVTQTRILKNDNNVKELIQANIPFDEFWNLYDKKVGDRKGCEKKYNSLTDEERIKIKETLPEFKKQFSEKQYQPHPSTYLNQKRWNDEIITTKPKQNGNTSGTHLIAKDFRTGF